MIARLFLLAALLISGHAWADAFSNTPPATPPDGTSIIISGGKLAATVSGCSNNCTFTGTTATGAVNASAGVQVTGTSPASGSLLGVTNTAVPQVGNTTGYQFLSSLTAAIPTTGVAERPNQFLSNLSVANGVTSTSIHENMWSSVTLTGAGTSGGEINQIHAYFQNDMSGTVTGNVEGLESNAINNGTLNSYQSLLALYANSVGSTTTAAQGAKFQLSNANATVASIGSYYAVDMEAMTGGGSQPTNYLFLRGADGNAASVISGNLAIGTLTPQATTTQFFINSAATTAGTTQFLIKNGNGNLVALTADGAMTLPQTVTFAYGSNNYIQVSGAVTGTAPFFKSFGSSDANVNINFAPKGTGVLSFNGTAGVSCTSGTVTAATVVVSGGLVTHC